MPTLHATIRTNIGKATGTLHKEGLMAAVVYGPKQDALSISVGLPEFTKILRDGEEKSVIELTGLEKPMQVLIHEVDRDPVTSVPRHADLYAIEKGAKIEVSVPLNFIGESAAVKAGANLVKVMHELPIEVAPSDLPHGIDVDISVLTETGMQIHVKDVKLPKGVVLMVEEDEVVALIQEVEVEAEEPSVGPDMAAIAVEKKGKDEEEAA